MSEQRQNRRAELRAQLPLIAFHLGAHASDDLRHARVDCRIVQPFALQHRAEDSEICVPVYWDAFNACFNTKHIAHGVAEGKIMDGIVAVQQSSINIKEVRCRRLPLKAPTDEGAWGSLSHVPGSWLGLLRRERSHSQLDSEMYANAAA